MMARGAGAGRSADAVVIGGGLVGLAAATALVQRGVRVLLLNDTRRGEASVAAAGVLAPSLSPHTGAAQEFAVLARDRFPEYVDWLRGETGVDIPLNRLGILELALDEAGAEVLRARRSGDAHWHGRAELATLEPALAHAAGAAHYPHDGAVNNLVLLRALKTYLGRHPEVSVSGDAAVQVAFSGRHARVITRAGARHEASHIVLAAGTWVSELAGLPRPLPIEPLRGQMLSIAGAPLRHVVYGGGGYVVPRPDGRTLIGATSEWVGFDAATTEEAVRELRAIAATITPALADRRMLNAWSGLRPMTPDLLPILGPDPDRPALLYACGHSRNGILLAPLSGECIAALATGETAPADLSPFRVERFSARAPA